MVRKFSVMFAAMVVAAALLSNAWLLFPAGLFAIWAAEAHGDRLRLRAKGDGG